LQWEQTAQVGLVVLMQNNLNIEPQQQQLLTLYMLVNIHPTH
jgi:hypothetical protein